MSVFSAIFDTKIKNFEQAFNVKDITTSAMKSAIREWYALYYADRPIPASDIYPSEDPCQRLPFTVINKLTKTVFSEYEAKASNDFSKMIMSALGRRQKQAMQQALIGGEAFLKPLLMADGRVEFSVIQRRNYLVLARNETDAITDIGTQESTELGGFYYTLLERRTIDPRGFLTIESRLYRSDSRDMIGIEVPLNTLDKYADLVPVNRLASAPLWSLGLIPIRCPAENCVDGSEDGVSVYAPAAGLIHNININEKQIDVEFENGESRLVVSNDLMSKDAVTGKRRFKDHVFVGLDDDPENIGVTIFSPAFREQSFFNRKNEYLRAIESAIGMQHGILSDAEEVQKTATEITSSKGEYAITISDFEQMWSSAVKEALRVCSILGRMYQISGAVELNPEKDAVLDFGDGILYDRDKVNQEMLSQVASGILLPERYLGWYYELPCDTPEDRAKIREDYMPEMEELTGGEDGEE